MVLGRFNEEIAIKIVIQIARIRVIKISSVDPNTNFSDIFVVIEFYSSSLETIRYTSFTCIVYGRVTVWSHLFCRGIQWVSVHGLFVRLPPPGDICAKAAGLLWLLTSLKLSRRRRRQVFGVTSCARKNSGDYYTVVLIYNIFIFIIINV